jgi:hypothetical protein
MGVECLLAARSHPAGKVLIRESSLRLAQNIMPFPLNSNANFDIDENNAPLDAPRGCKLELLEETA